METREFKIKMLTGVFCVVGLVLILWVMFTIGNDKGFTQPKFQVDVLFRDIGGLIEGAPVQLAGASAATLDTRASASTKRAIPNSTRIWIPRDRRNRLPYPSS